MGESDYRTRVLGADEQITTATVILMRVRDGRIVGFSDDDHNRGVTARLTCG